MDKLMTWLTKEFESGGNTMTDGTEVRNFTHYSFKWNGMANIK